MYKPSFTKERAEQVIEDQRKRRSLYRKFEDKEYTPNIIIELDKTGISYYELSIILNIKRTNFTEYFSNPMKKFKLEHIVKISKLLNISVGETAQIIFDDMYNKGFQLKKIKDRMEDAREQTQRNLEFAKKRMLRIKENNGDGKIESY